jgi:hypothetical protein
MDGKLGGELHEKDIGESYQQAYADLHADTTLDLS